MSSKFYNCKVSAANGSFNLIETHPEGRAGEGVLSRKAGHLHGAHWMSTHNHDSVGSKLERFGSVTEFGIHWLCPGNLSLNAHVMLIYVSLSDATNENILHIG